MISFQALGGFLGLLSFFGLLIEPPLGSLSSSSAPSDSAIISRLHHNMVLVEGGTFTMGCTNPEPGEKCPDQETPAHEVTLDDYYIGKYPVTNEEYCVFLNRQGNQTENGVPWVEIEESLIDQNEEGDFYPISERSAKFPATGVTWYGARAFAEWMARYHHFGYSLVTEAQWEFAARGGTKSQGYKYAGSNNEDELRYYSDFHGLEPYKVGKFKPNELGLYDMSGNVWEWCSDWYVDSYQSGPVKNPTGPEQPKGFLSNLRVVRGAYLRVTDRFGYRPNHGYLYVGFRLARKPSVKWITD